MAMVVVDDSCRLQADSQPKSRGLVWGSTAAWRCSTFIKWTEWTLAMTLWSWWQHYKHCHGYYYYYLHRRESAAPERCELCGIETHHRGGAPAPSFWSLVRPSRRHTNELFYITHGGYAVWFAFFRIRRAQLQTRSKTFQNVTGQNRDPTVHALESIGTRPYYHRVKLHTATPVNFARPYRRTHTHTHGHQ